jgi:death on curing protein
VIPPAGSQTPEQTGLPAPRPASGHGVRQGCLPVLDAKAAALLHSLARNHALIDGNKRLALGAVIAFYGLNGRRLTLTDDQAYDRVMNVAAGELDQAEEIAAILQTATAPWQQRRRL